MKISTFVLTLILLLASVSFGAQSRDQWQGIAKDAWIDGKAETALLLNGNLNAFSINTDVENGKLTLTGSVANETEKALAQELVSSLKGVTEVDNMLTAFSGDDDQNDPQVSNLYDKKVVTVVKTRLLFESQLRGTHIDVQANKGVVILSGNVQEPAEKQLAMTIAKNTSDVKNVIDRLIIGD